MPRKHPLSMLISPANARLALLLLLCCNVPLLLAFAFSEQRVSGAVAERVGESVESHVSSGDRNGQIIVNGAPAHIKSMPVGDRVGEKVLSGVQSLASGVAESTTAATEGRRNLLFADRGYEGDVKGLGGSVMSPSLVTNPPSKVKKNGNSKKSKSDPDTVWAALANLERDMQMLDKFTGEKAQLSVLELTMLSASVLAAGSGPLIFGGHITNVLAPSAAAFAASIGIGAEFVGKVAVADGKEVAAASIQCAAEAEGLLANAERAKAITPLCVGIGALAATLSLLMPALLDVGGVSNAQLATELYLIGPLLSVLSAAVSSLGLQEIRSYCTAAIAVGNRRFAKNNMVARTWLSSTEQIERKSKGSLLKWQTFALSVLPAPIFGALIPGTLATKTVVVSALAAAQSAYFLAQSEFALARGVDAVALKARSAAICDTYANQGARSAAILPFTSALSSLCAAATAAIVELPFRESLAATGGPGGMLLQIAFVALFPTGSALFSAAASVSKARCEVDADAATQAASTLALEYDGGLTEQPVLRPFQSVFELIRLSTSSSIISPLRRRWKALKENRVWKWLQKYVGRKRNDQDSKDSQEALPVALSLEPDPV